LLCEKAARKQQESSEGEDKECMAVAQKV
jgi:hypothetical protein